MRKAKDNGLVEDQDLSESERAELERLRKENAILRMERDFAKKVAAWFAKEQPREYAAIANWAGEKEFPVTFMCAQLGVVRQGYYRWLATGESERERTDAELTDQIREIHTELRGDPGVRRVWAELVVRGFRVARKRVWRLMKAAGLRGRHPRAWKKTTVAGQRPVDALDLIGQDFSADQPDTRWCGDITYVRTVEGWVYTATVIDLHSRKVVGYAVADHLRSSLIIEALAAALLTRKPPAGVIFPSDRGCQYTSREFADFCAVNGVRRSMGRRAGPVYFSV